ncbi:glutamate-1-semialdehyde 2,1-aminomutase [Brochothrix thermosphacta]|uniref:glutamate-1-semialdehyde 2,1-aminomutase n=1 Tax=Brochothrix thermosphacta TaxID=2756 RepID=UPI00271358ED|nr:glutamate-1-semialdehyde 2,1-aminomutase [Brochothrix thermosphacta]MDO7863336.1 glutamate-1-semialdehyde 2,1-aminomutase [Brochothrix thermosphacta]
MSKRNIIKSQTAFKEAVTKMPGGVSSPVRAFNSVDTDPVYFDRGKGAYLYDIDGNKYIDYVLSWGPLILGHANDKVVRAVQETAAKGMSFGANHLSELTLVDEVIKRVPSAESVRFVNSGTEATMSALRLARGYTGRDLIIKCVGSYHGHGDSLLIKAGSGVATLGLPDSPGVPKGTVRDTITVPYNDLEAVEAVFKQYKDQVAAIIVEPVAGNMGVVPPVENYLEGLREITKRHQALLIFDEVMTGFRVGINCAQGYFGVTPDLTCLGKVIGGGMPVGAYAGPREIMDNVAPSGPIYQAGTLSGNPLAMTAGVETLRQLTPAVYDDFTIRIDQLTDGIKTIGKAHQIPVTVNRAGSMFGFFFAEGPIANFEDVNRADLKLFSHYYREMSERGIYLPPSQFEGLFISTEHTKADIDTTLNAMEDTFKQLQLLTNSAR